MFFFEQMAENQVTVCASDAPYMQTNCEHCFDIFV